MALGVGVMGRDKCVVSKRVSDYMRGLNGDWVWV